MRATARRGAAAVRTGTGTARPCGLSAPGPAGATSRRGRCSSPAGGRDRAGRRLSYRRAEFLFKKAAGSLDPAAGCYARTPHMLHERA
ncbi:hypothetical protein GCM10010425_01750 [Streptomyces spororaveus]|uniref:Uncharacterized protein n=1 Tax=Streptomyces spororaveus TaxID=284039 RepID=A0ABQ3TCU8_9ACTN|nr:hypothetical protein Sspor_37540 [Streptomyces spororaveus]